MSKKKNVCSLVLLHVSHWGSVFGIDDFVEVLAEGAAFTFSWLGFVSCWVEATTEA